jgi:Swt1-like HEPN
MRNLNVDLPPEVTDQTLRTFLRLYQLETWMREMVYLELKAYYGTEWWTEVEGLKRPNISGHLAAKYRAKDSQHPHISTPETDPLWFISFDTLLKIILHPNMWKRFSPYFTTKKILRSKFEEIAPVRNRVAHCRSLHAYDLRRVEQLMLDFDQRFWRFCTSYQDRYGFVGNLSNNQVARKYADNQDVNVYYTVRPSLKNRRVKPELGRGIIYDVTITSKHPLSRFFDYEQILKSTRNFHKFVLHIVLDSFQNSIRVTIPGTASPTTVIEVVEKFWYACCNFYSIAPLVPHTSKNGNEEPHDLSREHEDRQRPFQLIAAQWPHYVTPSSHPYAFLDGSCPCSFFGIE